MALDPLTTSSEVAKRLRRSLTSDEEDTIDALIVDASAKVRNYTRQEITAGTSTTAVNVRNGTARLPQRPVTAVTAVVNAVDSPLLFRWDGEPTEVIYCSGDVPDSFAWEPFRCGTPRTIKVTYDHGYTDVPDDIVGVVCAMVLRAFGRPPEDGGLTSESIAGYSYSVGTIGAAGAFGLLPDERDVLDGYRRADLGNIQVGHR